MKKSLLFGSFAIFGLVANAQLVTLATSESLEAAGWVSGEKVNLDGNLVFAEGDAGTIATAYADQWGISGPNGAYKNIKVGNVEFTINSGAVGETNPTFVNYASGVMSAGAVFEIVPAADGWLTVFTKMNPNKQYVVFEGQTGAMSYTLGYTDGTEENTIYYTLPYDPDTYYIDFADYNVPGHVDDTYDDGSGKFTYFVAAGGELGTEDVKPNFPWKVAGLEKNPSDNTGFVMFNVLKDNKYYFSALGSKAPCGAMVLTESEEMPTVTYLATDELPAITFGGDDAGVEGIIDDVKVDGPVYNLFGQKVDNSYKGVVIKSGKKYIQK